MRRVPSEGADALDRDDIVFKGRYQILARIDVISGIDGISIQKRKILDSRAGGNDRFYQMVE